MFLEIINDIFFNIDQFGLPAIIQPVPWIVVALWVPFILESVGLFRIPNIQPRGSLVGIITCIFGHGNILHLVSNTLGLVALLILFFMYQTDGTWVSLTVLALGPGILYWAFGPPGVAARGASGVAFALVGWLVVYSLATGETYGLSAVFFAGVIYGAIKGMTPSQNAPFVSVSCHFWGFVAGVSWTAWDQGLLDPYLQRIG